jgi:hypothetical protein
VEANAGISDVDRAQLVKFLNDLHYLLERLLDREPALLSPRTGRLLQAAWRELEEEGRFVGAIRLIEAGEFDRALVDHGLYRDQLSFKQGVFEFADDAVKKDEGKWFRRFKIRKSFMSWALQAGNVVLGSLASAIPGAGAIQEFKDAAEAALDDRVSLRQRFFGSFKRSEAPQVVAPDEPAGPAIA